MCHDVRRIYKHLPEDTDGKVKKPQLNTAELCSSLLAGCLFDGPQQPVRSTTLQDLRRYLRRFREKVQRYLLPGMRTNLKEVCLNYHPLT